MKVVSTNIGERQIVEWRGKNVETGIFKRPTTHPIYLEEKTVKDDVVADLKHHGGIYKACYLYGANRYALFNHYYPEKELPFGMFGENITLETLDESKMVIGDTYQLGKAVVQVSEPRQPCFKLGIRFEDQGVLKHFIESGHSGVYLKVIESGEVKKDDTMVKTHEAEGEKLTIAEVFELLYTKEKIEEDLLFRLQKNEHLRADLKYWLIDKHKAN